mmetsp:Transcript_51407/g.135620  ORF Transcript_51407/g.135620 Transcript_51407/m.135620 type:complete len:236 (-) Transcript_51407:4159-4866(-)
MRKACPPLDSTPSTMFAHRHTSAIQAHSTIAAEATSAAAPTQTPDAHAACKSPRSPMTARKHQRSATSRDAGKLVQHQALRMHERRVTQERVERPQSPKRPTNVARPPPAWLCPDEPLKHWHFPPRRHEAARQVILQQPPAQLAAPFQRGALVAQDEEISTEHRRQPSSAAHNLPDRGLATPSQEPAEHRLARPQSRSGQHPAQPRPPLVTRTSAAATPAHLPRPGLHPAPGREI